jgi:hypothetical protein
MKPEIYSPPTEPIQEYEYPLEKISNEWTNQISHRLVQASTATKDALRMAVDKVSFPTLPDFIRNIPTDIKQVYSPDEALIPNMGYVLASGAGTSILMKKSIYNLLKIGGMIARVLVPTTVVMFAFYTMYPKTSRNVIEKYHLNKSS